MSIFNLKTNPEELKAQSQSISRMVYEEVSATREITADSFFNGEINYRFQVSGQKWWLPFRTYIKARVTLSQQDGKTTLLNASNIAPNMGLMANLFQSGEFYIQGKQVSLLSAYPAQIDALRTRMTKSKAWLDSIGTTVNNWEAKQVIRQNKVTSDGTDVTSHSTPTNTQAVRDTIGFDAAGANNNSAAYDATDGKITFAPGANASPLPNLQLAFPLGSYFVYLSDAAGGDGVVNVPMEVLTHNSATVITVRAMVAIDVAANGLTNFARITRSETLEPSRRVRQFEMVWQPPMSIFGIDHALPAGEYELKLTPQTSSAYMKRAIESALADKTGGAGADFLFQVDKMQLYLAVVDGPRADNVTYLLDLEETGCRVQALLTPELTQKYYDVSPTTYALTVAYQDVSVGTDTRYSASKFLHRTNEERNLIRMFVEYGHQTKPQYAGDVKYEVGKDYLTHRYIDTMLNSGAYFENGGTETLEEWYARGPYYHFAWPTDGNDKNTRVSVSSEFSALTGSQTNCVLFDHYRKVARVEVKDGRVQSVYVTNE